MDVGNASLNNTFEQDHCIMPHNVESLVTNNGDTALSYDNFDHFDFVLPQTIETSLNNWPENGDKFMLENNIVGSESNVPCDIPALNLLTSSADSDFTNLLTFSGIQTDDVGKMAVPQCPQMQKLPAKQMCETRISCDTEKEEMNRSDTSRKLVLEGKGTDGKLAEAVSEKEENISKKIPESKSHDMKSRACGLVQFPPCVICSGKASGLHYGAITCEACKGFFRRYLQKKTKFKCTNGRKCEIVSSKKGICSGCRLKKCLDLGMSKEKSKMGRYTLTKRTEAIINMNIHDRKQFTDSSQMRQDDEIDDENVMEPNCLNEGNSLIVSHILKGPKSLNLSGGFNDLLVIELAQCFNVFEPYGPNIKTKEQIAQAHKQQSEKYKQKVEMFGKMKAIPREEYNEIYTQYGIDIDGRMADMKLDSEDIDSDMAFYCNFAKHIPEFHNFHFQDQVSLLNSLMIDFYTFVYLDCYNDEYQTFIYKNGRGYHFDEMVGRELSEDLVTLSKNVYCRLQMLNLNTEERALMAALTLVSADRCKLQNRARVEKVQLFLTELLQTYLRKNRKEAGNGRFTKIIDTMTYMRELTDQYKTESNELCKDEVLLKEFPQMKEFFIEENY